MQKKWLRLCLVFSLAFCLLGCSKTAQLSAQEQSLLLTELDFAAFELAIEKAPAGVFLKEVNYLAHATDYTYEVTTKDSFYLHSTFSDEQSAIDAKITATAMRTGALIGLTVGEMKNHEIVLKNQFGGNAKLSLLLMHGKPAGNLFTFAHGSKSASVIFTGVYFDNEADFSDFFTPYITHIKFAKLH